jgi:NTP pyrophosphatase (non-canonical NTP hydrolase)
MTFQQIISKAVEVRKKFSQFEKQKYGREWTREELVQGFVGDVGDLSKLVQAKNGVRDIQNVDEKLKHELADCLWSVIVIADAYDIDLEQSFTKTINGLERKLDE